MVDNILIRCNFCRAKIRMRFQMGYFDIPFSFCCPECGVYIHGMNPITSSLPFNVNNAERIDGNPREVDFYADFSVELPHRKITKYVSDEQILQNGFSPFMMVTRLFTGDTYQKASKSAQRILAFRNDFGPRILPLYDLYFNNKISLSSVPFLKLSNRFVVKNELDAAMALHQMTIMGMFPMLPEGTPKEYIECANQITQKQNMNQVVLFINKLGGRAYFDSILKRLINIYKRWFVNLEKYMPVVVLSLGGAMEKFNKETHGIATISFEDMKAFYSDSYELLLEMVDIAVGLNNIALRGSYDSFSAQSNVKTYTAYQNQIKSDRLKSLIENEPFSKPIQLNRHVRNAIAHYDYEFKPNSQEIVFRDKHKTAENTVGMYLIDLASLCYENMSILQYLNELMYNLRKIDFCNAGLATNIKAPT